MQDVRESKFSLEEALKFLSFFSDVKNKGTDVERCSHNVSKNDEFSKLFK